MIKLTDMQGNAVYINPDRVIGIHLRNDARTRVNYGGESYVVRESPEEVTRKVLEWRLVMERHQAALITGKKEIVLAEYQHLKQLAGLEEPNHG